MKLPEILAPVNDKEEVIPLIEAGANWVYGGCLPAAWADKYPLIVPLNQRTFASAQFGSFQGLAEAVSLANESGGRFALTLNAPYYMDSQMEAVFELSEKARDSGVNALIVSDPGLIVGLEKKEVRIPIHMSTMAVAANTSAAGLFSGLGADRVILPRFLSIAEIRQICASLPELEFEAFAFVGKCPNVEGVCSFLHDSPERRWPCEWEYNAAAFSGGPAPPRVSRYLSMQAETDRRDACGLCAIPDLISAGVHGLKVVGRGAPLDRKTALVGVLSDAITMVKDGVPDNWIEHCKEKYRSIFGHKCTRGNCYYPEVVDTE